MKAFYLKEIIFLFIVLLCLGTTKIVRAQVDANINSGDPSFPFPQFLPYEGPGGHSLGNLATQNAPGVTHAEMERRIRDAWHIMTNNIDPVGESAGGSRIFIP